jgi:hypothetical protein
VSHLRHALCKVFPLQKRLVGEAPVDLIGQAARLAGRAQVRYEMADAVKPLGVEQQAGALLPDGQHTFGHPRPYALLCHAEDLCSNDRADRRRFAQFRFDDPQQSCAPWIGQRHGRGTVLQRLDALEKLARLLLLGRDYCHDLDLQSRI